MMIERSSHDKRIHRQLALVANIVRCEPHGFGIVDLARKLVQWAFAKYRCRSAACVWWRQAVRHNIGPI